ncbi:MAG TPA: cation-translocating P-type ATPase [Candidatus Limnocylindrales bacterium]|nr:cation-translocating P-type ATPase [Candidatus Limnocylindrales bacterium]
MTGPDPAPGGREAAALTPPADASLADGPAVAASLGVDAATGLAAADAADRLVRFGANRLDPAERVPTWRKFLVQFADPLIYLLLVAIGVSVVAWALEGGGGLPTEAIVIAAIVVANAVLGFLQERSAEQALAALQRMAAPEARLLRDGSEVTVPASEVVPGDLLVLREGDAIAADGRLLRAASLTIAEASLTGESEPILKDPATLPRPASLGDRLNMVFSGTAVTRGRGLAVVTATGMATEMGRIAILLGRTGEERTPLQREIDLLGRALGIAVVVIAIVIVAAILLTSGVSEPADFVDVLLIGVSLAVAAVPEGLPAIVTVILALGVQRMARQRAIVKKLSSVETLGSASVVASDKTGTLTQNAMTIQRIVTRSGEVSVSGIGYRPEGRILDDQEPLLPGPLFDEVRAVLAGGSLANDAELIEEDGTWTIRGDPTDAAFLVAERKLGIEEVRRARFRRRAEVPFSSERRLMTSIEADADRGGRLAIVTKGAADVLIGRCTRERVGAAAEALTDERRGQILAGVDRLAGAALRTLAVAYRPLEVSDLAEPDESVERELVFAGIVGMIDPARPEARAAIEEARGAGIRIMMITGDHPRTAARIAADLGIVPESGEADGAVRGDRAAPTALTGADLDELDDATFAERVKTVNVYARVAPEHKLRIVDALQADGNIVAMTGDGVNDAPALKAADIGVAMGISGTEVTKEAANMILVDDNFATIVGAVREGRAIFANLRKSLRYLLSSNAGEVLTMFLGVIGAGVIGLDVGGEAVVAPLLATQILWVNLLTDSAPALALGYDPPPRDVMRRRPRRLTDRVVDREMALGVLFVGTVMALATLFVMDLKLPGGLVPGSGGFDEARTAAFTVLVLAQLFNVLNSRSDRDSAFHRLSDNPRLFWAIALSLGLQVLVVHLPFLNEAFGTVPLAATDWLLCTAAASSVLWADELRKLALRRRLASR